MHRQNILQKLADYRESKLMTAEEEPMISDYEKFVAEYTDCFERTCKPGHVTASAWLLDSSRTRVLLTHHKKLTK